MLIALSWFLVSPTLRFHCCKATCKGYLAVHSSTWRVQWHEEGDTNCSLMAEVPLAGGEVTSRRLFCFSWQFLLGFVGSFLAHRLFSCEKQRGSLDFIIFCFHWLLENKAVTNTTEENGWALEQWPVEHQWLPQLYVLPCHDSPLLLHRPQERRCEKVQYHPPSTEMGRRKSDQIAAGAPLTGHSHGWLLPLGCVSRAAAQLSRYFLTLLL